MRIIELHLENLKRVRTITIAPKSAVVRINGNNASGKTSTLDGILWTLAGGSEIDMVPVREGEERGLSCLKLGDTEVKYVVTRSYRIGTDGAKTTTKLTVESSDGALYGRPQAKLDELFGPLSLDPLEFQQMSPKDRLDTLKKIVVMDVDVDELDRLNAGDFEKRSQVNRDIKAMTERVSMYAGGVFPDMDVTPVDTGAILAEMERASEHNGTIERLRASRVALESKQEDRQSKADDLRKHAAKLIAEAEGLEFEIQFDANVLSSARPLPEPIDVAELSEKVKQAQRATAERSLQRTARANHESAKAELATAQARAKQLTDQMEYRSTKKAKAIEDAAFPIPGLSFGEQGVLYKGLPFDQASGAEQLRVSLAIAAAMKPDLPVVLIKAGSLVDDAGMALIEEFCEEKGVQLFIERVGYSDRGFVLEDGELAFVDGVPVEHETQGEPECVKSVALTTAEFDAHLAAGPYKVEQEGEDEWAVKGPDQSFGEVESYSNQADAEIRAARLNRDYAAAPALTVETGGEAPKKRRGK